jgi:hypothetical protein
MPMLDVHQLKAEDLQGLDATAATKIALALLDRVGTMTVQIDEHAKQLAERDQAIKFKDAKLQKVTFELALLKAWKFGAKTETPSAASRYANRCRTTCGESFTATSPRTPTAPRPAVVGKWCASAKTSANAWTSSRRSSRAPACARQIGLQML